MLSAGSCVGPASVSVSDPLTGPPRRLCAVAETVLDRVPASTFACVTTSGAVVIGDVSSQTVVDAPGKIGPVVHAKPVSGSLTATEVKVTLPVLNTSKVNTSLVPVALKTPSAEDFSIRTAGAAAGPFAMAVSSSKAATPLPPVASTRAVLVNVPASTSPWVTV